MKITTIGLDLAKNAFQGHGVDERGKAVLKKQLKRAQVLPFFADLDFTARCSSPASPVDARYPGLLASAFRGSSKVFYAVSQDSQIVESSWLVILVGASCYDGIIALEDRLTGG